MNAAIPAPTWTPGTRVDGYEIIEHLASGGMADVFAAVPIGGGEPVVIKAMLLHLVHNEDFVRLFLDESQLVATLDHPGIARIHDRGEHLGVHYFVMEYVLGTSCRDVLNRASAHGGMPLVHVLDIATQIADALDYAHEKRGVDDVSFGIVHRDLSHSNVMLTYGGVVKLIDFGVAKSALRTTQTGSGGIKGKIRYMAPEQIRAGGSAVDRRADVFSLGVMLWEMSTGMPLFNADTDAAVMYQIVFDDTPRPSEHCPGYPPALEAIVMRALEKDPERRTPSAAVLRDELYEFAARAGFVFGGLADYARALYGTEIDVAHNRLERMRERFVPSIMTRLRRASQVPAPPPVSYSGVPALPSPSPSLTAPSVTPSSAAIRVDAASSAPFVLYPDLTAGDNRSSPSIERPVQRTGKRARLERVRIFVLVAIVFTVVGGGTLLSRCTVSSPSPGMSRPPG